LLRLDRYQTRHGAEGAGTDARCGTRGVRPPQGRQVAHYSYENTPKTFTPADEKKFRANRKAWEFFNAQAPSYRRIAVYWMMSAKKEETHTARLAKLIDLSGKGRRL
jgi:uncharacterized protein YdeI (YjbR/CyaY-like superfamily)